MQDFTFVYVEDFVEFIGGYRDRTGRQLFMFESSGPQLSLARYDVKIIESFCFQTAEQQIGYTDKQSELAVKLVLKYKKQLSNLSEPVYVPDTLDQFRLPIRHIDRTKSVLIQDEKFVVKFPFDTALISSIKKQTQEGFGSAQFNIENKTWYLAITESHLNWIMAVLPEHGFNIDPAIISLYKEFLQVEQQGQAHIQPELIMQHDRLAIRNAESSLINYVESKLGGFDTNNLLTLIDHSAILGYSVCPELLDQLQAQTDATIFKLLTNRSVKLPASGAAESIFAYAELTNRLPLHVYNYSNFGYKDNKQVMHLATKQYLNVAPKLLISSTNILIGTKRKILFNAAEKIIILE